METVTPTIGACQIGKSSQVVTLLEPYSKSVRTDLVSAETPSGSEFSSKLPVLTTSSTGSAHPSAACPSTTTVSVKTIWEEKQKISLSRERRATRILGIVMGVFVACWWVFFSVCFCYWNFCFSRIFAFLKFFFSKSLFYDLQKELFSRFCPLSCFG